MGTFASRNFKYLAIFGAVLMVYPLVVKWKATSGQDIGQEQGDVVVQLADEQDLGVPIDPTWHEDGVINDIIVSHMNALGGYERLVGADSVILLGTITEQGRVKEFYSIQKRPYFGYMRIIDGPFRFESWRDHENGWRRIKHGENVKEIQYIGSDELVVFRAAAAFDNPIIRYVFSDVYQDNKDEIEVSLLEIDASYDNWTGAWVRLVFPDGVEYRLFLDTEEFIIRVQKIAIGSKKFHIEFDKYSEYGEVLRPRSYRVFIDNLVLPVDYQVDEFREAKGILNVVFKPTFAGPQATIEER